MVKNSEQLGPLKTLPGDSRVTKLGNILRNLSLDELPQIINIIIGDMSFVGPRPDIYKALDELTDDENLRVSVTPGITGLAQVNGRSKLTKEQRMNYDLEYVRNCSFILDVSILFKTVIKVIKKENINSSLNKN
jgi:lipopolysaccharide/colanic/teichoic acid biosynthesis glycosyltransferase